MSIHSFFSSKILASGRKAGPEFTASFHVSSFLLFQKHDSGRQSIQESREEKELRERRIGLYIKICRIVSITCRRQRNGLTLPSEQNGATAARVNCAPHQQHTSLTDEQILWHTFPIPHLSFGTTRTTARVSFCRLCASLTHSLLHQVPHYKNHETGSSLIRAAAADKRGTTTTTHYW